MVIYAKVQMTGNWPQISDCVIISPSTTACSSAREKNRQGLERNQMSEDLPNTNKTPKLLCFLLGCAVGARLSIELPLSFLFFLKMALMLHSYCWCFVCQDPGGARQQRWYQEEEGTI